MQDLFTNVIDLSAHESFDSLANLRVSSHLYISREGALTQFVPFDKRAWHAGKSEFQRRSNCNDFAIGIELEGSREYAFEEVQYQVLVEVLGTLMENYPDIVPSRIVGHNEIAIGRKWDPGPTFDWTILMRRLLGDAD